MVHSDVSEAVIAKMNASHPNMSWVVADATTMGTPGGAFGKGDFDFVFEKGTFDAIEGDKETLRKALVQSRAVLRPGGKLVSVTIRDTQRTEQFALAYGWSVDEAKQRCKMSRKLLQGGTHIHVCAFD